ncbi:MAG: PEP-CTERM sorting domain-containing protein [Pirellulales bacterium]|nr:PEP-CTERM sorting domain-containing protein [Pirellulales bacterium]
MTSWRTTSWFSFVFACILFISASPLCAAVLVDPNGVGATDVVPADPSAWDSDHIGYVGQYSRGELRVDGGSEIQSSRGILGYLADVTGVVEIEGTGSSWTNTSGLSFGYYGNGILRVAGGGTLIGGGSIAAYSGSTGYVNIDGIGSSWGNDHAFDVGLAGNGTLEITRGGVVASSESGIGISLNSNGLARVDGAGSTWTNTYQLIIGEFGTARLEITRGGTVSNLDGSIGYESTSSGSVKVDGIGSTWTNHNCLFVGDYCYGSGTLEITNGGLVSAFGGLRIDDDADGDSYINIATGGMLALYGNAQASLDDFLGLANGTDAIRYWDNSISNWAHITGAVRDTDYTLTYLADGDLAGYTLLTVGTVPEPNTIFLLLTASACWLAVRRRQVFRGS